MEQPMIKTIEIYISKGIETIEHSIHSQLLQDFNDFKQKNELIYCAMHQEKPIGNSINVSFSTTIKYKDKMIDSEKLLSDFNLFKNDNHTDFCQITKTSHQDSTLIAEFTIFRTYQLKFV